MRRIDYIVCHCTATEQTATVENIKKYWREKLKWKQVGYHYIILPSGQIEQLADESEVTNGVGGYNSHSIHLSYIGGKLKDDRTEAQRNSIIALVTQLKRKYPNAKIQGHKDFPKVTKSCPRFNAIDEFKHL